MALINRKAKVFAPPNHILSKGRVNKINNESVNLSELGGGGGGRGGGPTLPNVIFFAYKNFFF